MTGAAPQRGWLIALRIIVLVILLSFCAGYLVAHFKHESTSLRGNVIAFGFAALAAGSLFQLVRDGQTIWRGMADMPTRERKASQLLLSMLAVGAVVGVGIVLAGGMTGSAIPMVGSMSAVLAILLSLLIVTIGPWVTWRWWTTTDEHERQAYTEGAHVAASAALYAGLAWWLLSRAALAPPPDGMVIIFGISLIWSAVWLYRKYS